MAARTRSSKTPDSCESSNGIKSCRHVDKSIWEIKSEEFSADIGQTEPHAKTMDKKPKEVKKLKKVKFAVEAMEIEANDAKVKNESDGRKIAMDAHYGLNSAKWSRVENGQVVEPEGIIEPSHVVVVGTSLRE